MSYGGYSQLLCKNGHYWTLDCYSPEMEDHDWCNKPLICPICNEEAVWHNMVNITNGSWDEEGKRIDGYIELKEKKKISGICSCCGAEHVCEINYEIPKNKK